MPPSEVEPAAVVVIGGGFGGLNAALQLAAYWSGQSPLQLDQLRSGFACALHMHQPTIPAGPDGALISHLQYMLEHPAEGDNHNAEPFAHCYRRLADLIPQLIQQGCSPRIMLDISGNLLWGAEQMGRSDITEAWHYLACDPQMQRHVEWLGTFWGPGLVTARRIEFQLFRPR